MRLIDDATIRAEAFFIESEVKLLIGYLDQLEKRKVTLGDEMEFADPLKDRDFEQFMVNLARALRSRDALKALSESAHAMQKFGLPLHAETPIRNHAETRFADMEVAHA